MKKGWKALAAFLLALMLPLGGACASIAGLDETLAGYLDTDGDLRYSFALQVGTLLPYGEETLTMMNGVLEHIRVAASETDAGAESTLALCVDGESVMDLNQHKAGETAVPLLAEDGHFSLSTAAPILSEGDVLGCVVFVDQGGEPEGGEVDYKLAQSIAGFLGRHMEG